jgi:hypothetical protein
VLSAFTSMLCRRPSSVTVTVAQRLGTQTVQQQRRTKANNGAAKIRQIDLLWGLQCVQYCRERVTAVTAGTLYSL